MMAKPLRRESLHKFDTQLGRLAAHREKLIAFICAGVIRYTHAVVGPELWDALLKHPSITDNQQSNCTLLATTRALRAAVTAQCSGRLTVQLAVAGRQQQRLLQLAAWLKQHATLVGRVALQLSRYQRDEYKKLLKQEEQCPWSDELQAVTTGLKQADSQQGRGYLQHLSLEGEPIPSELLDVLPARSLTSLRCELQPEEASLRADTWYCSVKAVSQLTQLRELDINSSGPYGVAGPDALKDLTSLQHLTRLQLGAASVYQLQYLPPHLKELQVAISMQADQDARALAPWLQKHASSLTQLKIAAGKPTTFGLRLSHETWQGLVEALREAASAAGGLLQLQHLTVCGIQSSLEFYQQVANSCNLLSLACVFDGPLEAREATYGVICNMTTLRELSFLSTVVYGSFNLLGVNALQHLSPITGLTRLYMNVLVSQTQLEHVPNSVRDLVIRSHSVCTSSLGRLDNLARLEIPYLTCGDRGVLPQNLVALKLRMRFTSLEPLTCLQSLQELHLWSRSDDEMIASVQLLSLTCLSSLTDLSLSLECGSDKQPSTSDVQAWASLPLRSLTITDEDMSVATASMEAMPASVIMGLTSLHVLTRLEMSCNFPRDALLQALPLCTRLQLLQLHGNLLGQNPDTYHDVSLFQESDHHSIEGGLDSDKGGGAGVDIGVDVGVDDMEVDKICDTGCDAPDGDVEVDVQSEVNDIEGPGADAETEEDIGVCKSTLAPIVQTNHMKPKSFSPDLSCKCCLCEVA